MKKLFVLAGVVALAACSDNASEVPEVVDESVEASVDAGFEAVAPGDYTVLHDDGTIDRLTIHPGLTWSMVFADNEAAGGTIFAQGGKNCFVTEGVEGHQCFEGSEPAEDGSMQVAAEDGEVMTVSPLADEED
jgi:hypothetical protein